VSVTDRDIGYRELVQLMQRIAKLDKISVLIGIRGRSGKRLVTIATVHEFGTRDGRIPERSYLRSTVDEHRLRYIAMVSKAAKKIVEGADPTQVMGLIGSVAVGDVQRKIANRIPPPNAPSTIARKGSDVPLIDTGRLRQSIDYVVKVK